MISRAAVVLRLQLLSPYGRGFSALNDLPKNGINIKNSLRGGSTTLEIKRDEKPLSWYSCGPTVYDSAHLGHARTYICTDILRRIITEYFNIELFFAMGITDVDDKIIKRADELGIHWKHLALKYEKEFKNDLRQLNVLEPDVYLPVTEHIPNIISYISGILNSGHAYQAADGVYFSVDALGEKYGCLGNNRVSAEDPAEEDPGEASHKKSKRDFALWKSVLESESGSISSVDAPLWSSPWGRGRPGWHIECSAMTHACFGSTLDIHSGGIDLLFPHHTNEIAQCVAHNHNDPWVRYWLHTGHLHIEGRKMSKSLKNFVSIKDYLGFNWTASPADDIRLYFLSHKYHSTLHFSKDRLIEAECVRNKFESFFHLVKRLKNQETPRSMPRYYNESLTSQRIREQLCQCRIDVHNALADDFDTPTAMRKLIELVTSTTPAVMKSLNDVSESVQSIYAADSFLKSVLSTFGLAFATETNESVRSKQKKNREHVTIDKLVEFRSSIRELCLDEIKRMKTRNDTTNIDAIDPVEASSVTFVKKALSACDEVRDTLKSDVGVSVHDLSTSGSKNASSSNVNALWHFVDGSQQVK